MFSYRGKPEWRRVHPLMGEMGDEQNGAAIIPNLSSPDLQVIFSAGEGWEHVSVSTLRRPPTWAEMCRVKELFWSDDACVIQYHPPKANYVNHHPHCLHLWRPIELVIPMPPVEFV